VAGAGIGGVGPAALRPSLRRSRAWSFVPPRVIAEVRDVTRHRKKLFEEHTREDQRLQKALKEVGVKLDSVVTNITGKATRRMIEALIAGERLDRMDKPRGGGRCEVRRRGGPCDRPFL
jgi:hypothetical protein